MFVQSALAIEILPIEPHNTIRADYQETIMNPQAILYQHPGVFFPQVTAQENTVSMQQILLLYGTHRYLLQAADQLNNPAVHELFITVSQPQITLVEPSQGGMSRAGSYSLEVSTAISTRCYWRPHSPNDINSWNRLVSDNNHRAHSVPDFSNMFPLIRGELFYVDLRCEDIPGLRIAQIGWSEQEQIALTSAHITQWPPISLPQEHTTITIQTEQQSTCRVEGTNQHSIDRNTHTFSAQGGTTIALVCTNAHGTILPRREYIVATHPQSTPFTMRILSPDITQTFSYQLIVQTNKPARCTHDQQGEQRLGALQQQTLHQQALVLTGTTNNIRVTCVYGEETITIPHPVRVQQTPLELQSVQAYSCQDTTVITAQSPQNTRYLLIQYIQAGAVQQEALRAYTGEPIRHPIGLQGQTLHVRAINELGVVGNPMQTVIQAPNSEACAYPRPQDISIVSPRNGVAVEPFTLALQTQFPSNCVLTQNPEIQFTPNQVAIRHTLHEAIELIGIQRGETTYFSVTCTDFTDQSTTKNLRILYDLPEPTFTLSANPAIVTSLQNPHSTILIEADQYVECYEGESAQGRTPLARTAEIEFSIPPNGKTITITCENPHQRKATNQITVHAEYPVTNQIIPLETIVEERQVTLRADTTRPANCRAVFSNTEIPLFSQTGFTHRATQIFSEGVYDFVFVCSERETLCEACPPNPCRGENPPDSCFIEFCGEEITPECREEYLAKETTSQEQNFIVDITPPTIEFNGEQLTCGLTSYTVSALVTDNIPNNIEEIIIQFIGINYTVQSLPHTLTSLELVSGEEYELRIWAIDKNNNKAGPKVISVRAQSRETGSCDTVPPIARLHTINETVQSKTLQVICQDDISCASTYRKGIVAPNAACEYSEHTFPAAEDSMTRFGERFTITETSRICVEVSDHAGNIAQQEIRVTIPEYLSHCSNGIQDADETGVDCGGSCPACPPIGSDLEHQQQLCSNGEQNQGQTDIDCGGAFCPKCEVGKKCVTNFDCASGSCRGGICAEPSCTDGIRNGDETGIDCGGSCPNACAQGQGCRTDSDCQGSLICSTGTCTDRPLQQPRLDEPFPIQESRSVFPLIFIILGLLLISGGGGYIYYEKQQESTSRTSFRPPQTTYQPTQQSTILQQQKTEPEIDLATSKLREEAKKKREEERKSKREQLVKEFE